MFPEWFSCSGQICGKADRAGDLFGERGALRWALVLQKWWHRLGDGLILVRVQPWLAGHCHHCSTPMAMQGQEVSLVSMARPDLCLSARTMSKRGQAAVVIQMQTSNPSNPTKEPPVGMAASFCGHGTV